MQINVLQLTPLDLDVLIDFGVTDRKSRVLTCVMTDSVRISN